MPLKPTSRDSSSSHWCLPQEKPIHDEDDVTAKCQRCIRKLDALKRQIEEAKGPTIPTTGETVEQNKAGGIHIYSTFYWTTNPDDITMNVSYNKQ